MINNISFKEWLNSSLSNSVLSSSALSNEDLVELDKWFHDLSNAALKSISTYPGFISLKFVLLPDRGVMDRPVNQKELIAACVGHSGVIMSEVGWKGDAALGVVDKMGIKWGEKDRERFRRGMGGGRRSLPSVIGREMGLLFEVMVFRYLLGEGLRSMGERDGLWSSGEEDRLMGEIRGKVGDKLGGLVYEFMGGHVREIGGEIFSRAKLVGGGCLDSVEFTGGDGGMDRSRLRSDTADLRVGCGEKIIGFSLKAVTETQVDVRTFSIRRAIKVLGGSGREFEKNPLMDEKEMRVELIGVMEGLARKNFEKFPKRFGRLLTLLVTGGGNTLPAYKGLLGGGGVGWGEKIGNDFGIGRVLRSEGGIVRVVETVTYMKMIYMVSGGNRYGTSVIFEPSSDGSRVSVVVSNLISRG